jgi:hypothetical protein
VRNTWWKRGLLGLALSASMLFSSPAEATVAVQLERAQLVDMSDLVVRATVLGATSQWNEDHSQILTLTRLGVTQYLKGAGPTELVLRQFGGQVGDLVSRIAGDAHLEAGQDVVLCLRRGAGVVYLTAMAQSAWYVTPVQGAEPVASRDLSGLTLTRFVNGRMQVIEQVATDAPESLPRLVEAIAAAARAPRSAR